MTARRETFVRPRPDEISSSLYVWANEIEVKLVGDRLLIFGFNPKKLVPQDLLELFHEYAFAPTRGREPKGPHLEFANAESDEEMIGFIKKWGPVAAPWITEQSWSKENSRLLWGVQVSPSKQGAYEATITGCKKAVESLRRVRAAQAVVAAAVNLLKVSREENPKRQAMMSTTNQLVEALMSQRDTLIDSELSSNFLISKCKLIRDEAERTLGARELSGLCRELLCTVVNQFPENLISTKGGVLSVPFAGHGVLPLLMFMLRQDLTGGRRILTCEKCGDYFLRRRVGERACSSCKGALRSQRYYMKNTQKVLRARKRKRRLKTKAKRLAHKKVE